MASFPFSKGGRSRTSAFCSTAFITALGLMAVWALWCFLTTAPSGFGLFSYSASPVGPDCSGGRSPYDPPDANFYDDPELSYTIDRPVRGWDSKRRAWLERHPAWAPGVGTRVLLVTGSQATPCRNPIGDHFLLRLFKNKVDYSRIHGYDIFYNNVLLQPEMFSFWAKVPTIRAAMLAHPEAEWIWWLDSDAAITDMDFKLPLDKYKDYNLVVHGWLNLIYEKKSWTSVNAGVFLIRNNQWSMDFMDEWANMGPQSPDYDKWGRIQRQTFKDKSFPESDDQSGLIYLILTNKSKLANKIYVENEYYFQGYWLEISKTFDNITEAYLGTERQAKELRRRHAEVVRESYAKKWDFKPKDGGMRRPFVTHFTGCQPCSGEYNRMYTEEACSEGMNRALNFADNQVLRNYGFVRKNLSQTSSVDPLPFDFPA